MQKKLLSGLFWILLLNLLIKPFWILGIETGVQNAVGTVEYGFYFTIFNLAYIFNILLDLGVTNFNTRNIARHPVLIDKHLPGILGMKLLLVLLYGVVTFTVGLAAGYSSRQFALLAILTFNQFLNSLILFLRSNFEGLMLFKWDSVISILDRVVMIAICSMMLWGPRRGITVEWFALAQTAAYTVTAATALVVLTPGEEGLCHRHFAQKLPLRPAGAAHGLIQPHRPAAALLAAPSRHLSGGHLCRGFPAAGCTDHGGLSGVGAAAASVLAHDRRKRRTARRHHPHGDGADDRVLRDGGSAVLVAQRALHAVALPPPAFHRGGRLHTRLQHTGVGHRAYLDDLCIRHTPHRCRQTAPTQPAGRRRAGSQHSSQPGADTPPRGRGLGMGGSDSPGLYGHSPDCRGSGDAAPPPRQRLSAPAAAVCRRGDGSDVAAARHAVVGHTRGRRRRRTGWLWHCRCALST